MATEEVKMKGLKTVEGAPTKVIVKGDKVMVEKANVVKTDGMASNGIGHVTGAVIIPRRKERSDLTVMVPAHLFLFRALYG